MCILHFYKVLTPWLFRHIFHSLSWVMQSMNCLTLKSNCSLLLKSACPAAAWSCGASAAPDIPISQEWMSVNRSTLAKRRIYSYTEKKNFKSVALLMCLSQWPVQGLKIGEIAKQKMAREARSTICEIIFVTVICLVLLNYMKILKKKRKNMANCENNLRNFDIGLSWEMCVLHARNYTWVLKILGGRIQRTLEFALFWFILFQNLRETATLSNIPIFKLFQLRFYQNCILQVIFESSTE